MRSSAFVIVCLLALAAPSAWAQTKAEKELAKYEKSLVKTEAALAQGNYKSAKSQLTKARKKIVSKLGAQNVLAPRMYLIDARCDLGLGMPKDSELDVENALKTSFTIHGESSEKYAAVLIDVADASAGVKGNSELTALLPASVMHAALPVSPSLRNFRLDRTFMRLFSIVHFGSQWHDYNFCPTQSVTLLKASGSFSGNVPPLGPYRLYHRLFLRLAVQQN